MSIDRHSQHKGTMIASNDIYTAFMFRYKKKWISIYRSQLLAHTQVVKSKADAILAFKEYIQDAPTDPQPTAAERVLTYILSQPDVYHKAGDIASHLSLSHQLVRIVLIQFMDSGAVHRLTDTNFRGHVWRAGPKPEPEYEYIKITCHGCGEDFEVRSISGGRVYCTPECRSRARYKRKFKRAG